MYSVFDAGNFYVIPGSPTEAWEARNYMSINSGHDPRVEMGYSQEDFLIALAGSQFSYSGLWLEQALVLQAIAPLRQEFSSASHLKVAILNGNSTDSYKAALEVILSCGTRALVFDFECMHCADGMSGPPAHLTHTIPVVIP